MMRMSSMPARTASSTTYWIAGLSTTGSISLGCALVAGRKRVPSPAAGMTALRTLMRLTVRIAGPAAILWHSHHSSANAWELLDAHVRVPLQGVWRRPRGRAGVHRRRVDRVPQLRWPAAQGLREHRDHVQGLGLLQDRQPVEENGGGHQ